MKKINKYLQQIRLFRIEQQINRSTFEMALYFDLFGINENRDILFALLFLTTKKNHAIICAI